MRIAILGQNIQPPWNEAVKNMAFELARQLSLAGHEVHLVTNGNLGIDPVPRLEVHSLPSQGFGRAAIDKIRHLEAAHAIDVVHVQNLLIHRPLSLLLRIFRRSSKLPIVAYCCQLPSLSLSHWVQVFRKDPKEAFSTKLGMLAPAFATRWTIDNVDVTIASSAFIRDHISSPKQHRNVEVIHPFLRQDILKEKLAAPSARYGPARLLYLGSHKVLRGEEDFLSMLAILRKSFPDMEGVAITTHPIPKRVQRQVESLGIEESVKFLSRAIELDVPSLMEASDLYVFTGLPPIGSIDPPLSIIESLILGTPVASYDAGGIGEVLNSDNLVEYGDRNALAELATKLLKERGARRQRPDLLKSFSSEAAVKRFEEIYHKVS